jgi:hypothetical protein
LVSGNGCILPQRREAVLEVEATPTAKLPADFGSAGAIHQVDDNTTCQGTPHHAALVVRLTKLVCSRSLLWSSCCAIFVRVFQNLSGSMILTLLINDLILRNKFHMVYGFR